MITITKEDAEFLSGFIGQWLPVCGERTAERARAVKNSLTAEGMSIKEFCPDSFFGRFGDDIRQDGDDQ